MNSIRIKNANFYYTVNNTINRVISGSFTGYGNQTFSFQNNSITDSILDPTGLQPAVFYKTGILTGLIPPGVGSFTWLNEFISGTGEQGRVYLNYITGLKPATNVVEFLNATGSGLNENDTIFLGGYNFIFRHSPSPPLEFNSPQNLINILNSGYTGVYDNFGFTNLVGVTGTRVDNKLFLTSASLSGENGNSLRIYSETQNPDAIKISNRYFSGGETFRPLINSWTGNFSDTFSFTVENSGFYNIYIDPFILFQNISGTAWVDNFSGNYGIVTGLLNPESPDTYSGQSIPFINTQYLGSGVIPSGQTQVYTGLKIEISKRSPYNISGNIAKYTFSGENFIFSGLIEG